MANFRSTLCFLAFGVAYLACLPLENENDLEDFEKNETAEDYIIIDQRQNGSENYRINIDGVIIALTPLESLLNGVLDDFDFDDIDVVKPSESTSTEKNGNVTTTSNATATISEKSMEKYKRRRYGVSSLMRTIFNQKKKISSKKQ